MPALWIAVVLGLVEGATEFLPVSSTGHLVLVGHLLGFTGERAEVFDIAIQAGAMAAVLGLYRDRFRSLLRPAAPGAFGGGRGVLLLALTTAPVLAVGYALRHVIPSGMEPRSVAIALAVGAVALIAVERWRRGRGGVPVEGLTPRVAFAIGVCQCLALWPGFSRAGATIGGGMAFGLARGPAAEWSYLAAVPAILAATVYKLWSARDALASDDLAFLTVGFLASAVSAFAAVRLFTAWLRRTTLVPFAIYRLVLAGVVFLALA